MYNTAKDQIGFVTELHMGVEKLGSNSAYGMVTFASLDKRGQSGRTYRVRHDEPQKFYLHYDPNRSDNAQGKLTRNMVPALIDVR